jgi:hypothetical protein
LEKGEIIKKGDQCDRCANPWKDMPKWEDVVGNIGEPAPDPQYPAHRQYRRPVYPSGYEVLIEAMRQSTEPSAGCRKVDAPAVVIDIRDCFLHEIDVPPGQAAAVIDYLLEVIEQLRDSNHGLRSALNSRMGVSPMQP